MKFEWHWYDMSPKYLLTTRWPTILPGHSLLVIRTLLMAYNVAALVLMFLYFDFIPGPQEGDLEPPGGDVDGGPLGAEIWMLLTFHMACLTALYFVLIILFTFLNRSLYRLCLTYSTFDTIPMYSPTPLGRFLWILFEVVVSFIPFVVVIHWALEYPRLVEIAPFATLASPTDFAVLHLHAVAPFTLLVELFINQVLFVHLHMLFPLLFGALYAVFAWAMWQFQNRLVYWFLARGYLWAVGLVFTGALLIGFFLAANLSNRTCRPKSKSGAYPRAQESTTNTAFHHISFDDRELLAKALAGKVDTLGRPLMAENMEESAVAAMLKAMTPESSVATQSVISRRSGSRASLYSVESALTATTQISVRTSNTRADDFDSERSERLSESSYDSAPYRGSGHHTNGNGHPYGDGSHHASDPYSSGGHHTNSSGHHTSSSGLQYSSSGHRSSSEHPYIGAGSGHFTGGSGHAYINSSGHQTNDNYFAFDSSSIHYATAGESHSRAAAGARSQTVDNIAYIAPPHLGSNRPFHPPHSAHPSDQEDHAASSTNATIRRAPRSQSVGGSAALGGGSAVLSGGSATLGAGSAVLGGGSAVLGGGSAALGGGGGPPHSVSTRSPLVSESDPNEIRRNTHSS